METQTIGSGFSQRPPLLLLLLLLLLFLVLLMVGSMDVDEIMACVEVPPCCAWGHLLQLGGPKACGVDDWGDSGICDNFCGCVQFFGGTFVSCVLSKNWAGEDDQAMECVE